MPLLSVQHVKKIYATRLGGAKVQALSDVDFTVGQGEFAAIMGESGSGKTTLLNILAGLDKPTGGQVFLNQRDICTLGEKEISAFRRDNLGFVFQDFNLLDTFSIQDNIFLPLVLAGKKYDEMHKRLEPIAQGLGIADILQKFPYEVSGGQKQRAAIARAIITQPQLILADEPTGALDSRSAGQIMDIFGQVNRQGQTVLMVTHSIQAASRAGRVLFIKDGQVFHQIYRGEMDDGQMYQRISDTLAVLTTGGGPTHARPGGGASGGGASGSAQAQMGGSMGGSEGVQGVSACQWHAAANRPSRQARPVSPGGVEGQRPAPGVEQSPTALPGAACAAAGPHIMGEGHGSAQARMSGSEGVKGPTAPCGSPEGEKPSGGFGQSPRPCGETRSVSRPNNNQEGFGGEAPKVLPASPRHLEAARGQEEGGVSHG